MRKLAKLSVEGNHISIVPTELGLLTTLNALTYDTKTFLPVPSEIFNLGQDAVLQFLLQACCPPRPDIPARSIVAPAAQLCLPCPRMGWFAFAADAAGKGRWRLRAGCCGW